MPKSTPHRPEIPSPEDPAAPSLELNPDEEIDRQKQLVIDEIRAAFLGVTLEEGIGLQEANGIDDYEDEETLAALRASDEKEDWEKIPAARLNDCFCSPGFFDAKGMRFHLPAFLTAELRGEYGQDFELVLTHLTEYRLNQFVLLNDPQRLAIRSFLLLHRDHPDFYSDHCAVDQALAEYWTIPER